MVLVESFGGLVGNSGGLAAIAVENGLDDTQGLAL